MKIPEPDYEALKNRSLLEVLRYDLLIQGIEEHIIRNKEPFLYKTEEEVDCGEILFLEPVPLGKKFDLYFHLGDAKNIDFKIDRKRKHKKITIEEDMHKGVKLTLVYY